MDRSLLSVLVLHEINTLRIPGDFLTPPPPPGRNRLLGHFREFQCFNQCHELRDDYPINVPIIFWGSERVMAPKSNSSEMFGVMVFGTETSQP